MIVKHDKDFTVPDASYYWTIRSRCTKTGRERYVETDPKFQANGRDAEKDIED